MFSSFEVELPTYNIQEVYKSEYQPLYLSGITKSWNKPKLWLGLIALGLVYHLFVNRQ